MTLLSWPRPMAATMGGVPQATATDRKAVYMAPMWAAPAQRPPESDPSKAPKDNSILAKEPCPAPLLDSNPLQNHTRSANIMLC